MHIHSEILSILSILHEHFFLGHLTILLVPQPVAVSVLVVGVPLFTALLTTRILAEFHPAGLGTVGLHLVVAELPVTLLVIVLAGVNDIVHIVEML